MPVVLATKEVRLVNMKDAIFFLLQ